jgi:orotate phosphoribosyltransferase
MENMEKKTARLLLECRAVELRPDKPFQWASGWKSPIYCDNRKTLSYPEIRNFIKDSFVTLIKEKYFSTEAIAGVATGAIAQGALVADALDLPFFYVRPEPKSHGLENLIEGDPQPGQRVVVIEDLVSTGGSSLKAVEALRRFGCEVSGMLAVFTYGFPIATENFGKAGCVLTTLSNYEALLELALELKYIREDTLDVLQQWRKNPETWNPAGCTK